MQVETILIWNMFLICIRLKAESIEDILYLWKELIEICVNDQFSVKDSASYESKHKKMYLWPFSPCEAFGHPAYPLSNQSSLPAWRRLVLGYHRAHWRLIILRRGNGYSWVFPGHTCCKVLFLTFWSVRVKSWKKLPYHMGAMKIQTSLCMYNPRPSLSAYTNRCFFQKPLENCKSPDQTVWMCRLVWAFTCAYNINFLLMWLYPNIPPYKVLLSTENYLNFSYFSAKKMCCGYSFEAPQWGASNEYPQHTFSWRSKKNIIWIHLLAGAVSQPESSFSLLDWNLIHQKNSSVMWFFFFFFSIP